MMVSGACFLRCSWQKRQELQKKITELNQQLKQHQMEQKREARKQAEKEKESSMEDMSGGTKKENSGAGLSTGSMQSMISADSSMKQARVQGRENLKKILNCQYWKKMRKQKKTRENDRNKEQMIEY